VDDSDFKRLLEELKLHREKLDRIAVSLGIITALLALGVFEYMGRQFHWF
jgi:hypothetical protein